MVDQYPWLIANNMELSIQKPTIKKTAFRMHSPLHAPLKKSAVNRIKIVLWNKFTFFTLIILFLISDLIAVTVGNDLVG